MCVCVCVYINVVQIMNWEMMETKDVRFKFLGVAAQYGLVQSSIVFVLWMMATMTTTTMMMVMDGFKDLGVVLCRPSRLISKVIAYVNMEVSCVLHREYYMEYYCHQLHNEFLFQEVLPILVIQQFLYKLFVKLICIHTLLLCKLICEEHGY